jgi:choice-of-anchor B domain-containing protein
MNKRTLIGVAAALAAVTLLVWSSSAHEGEHHSPGGNGQPGGAPLSALGLTPCVNGMAGTFPCNNVDLAAFLPIADIDGTPATDITANDVWGWTDPLTGKEHALLGLSNGISFVDVSAPESPVYLGNLPTHTVNSLWRGVKVYRNHAYIISEAASHGMQVFDLTRLRNVTTPQTFTETAYYDGFTSAHTIAVNDATGYIYVAGSRANPAKTVGTDTCAARGLHIVDARNPAAPVFAGCVENDGYTHETQCVIYRGPDAQYQGREICFSSNEDTLTIIDVTNKAAPAQLSRTAYVGRGYTHQGWLTEDQRMFLLDDELDEQQQRVNTRTFVWDVSDLDAPTVKNVYQGQTASIDHNLYVRGRYAFESNYRSGVRVLDAAGASAGSLSEVGFFDVYPSDDQAFFNGTWSNFPHFASGIVIASGIEQGLFVLRPRVEQLPVRIDYAPFFVRQQYLDFLGREPDGAGQDFWTFAIASCVANQACADEARVNVSTAFFVSIEFQNTGYLIHRFHAASFPNSLPRFAPFIADLRKIGDGVIVGALGWEQKLEANKAAFAAEWVQRPEFIAQLPLNMTATEYVNALFANAQANPTQAERDAALSAFGASGADGRARALRSVADSASVYNRQYNSAFVLMQYFGYLRRNPDDAPDLNLSGYQFWLDKLDSFTQPGEDARQEQTALNRVRRAEMVRAFINASEYRARFGQ